MFQVIAPALDDFISTVIGQADAPIGADWTKLVQGKDLKNGVPAGKVYDPLDPQVQFRMLTESNITGGYKPGWYPFNQALGRAGEGTVAFSHRTGHETGVMTSSSASAFAGFRFPREVISVAVRWYLRYGLSYRDVEELLAERGVTVDHVTVYRWVQRFTPEFVEAARTCRHVPGDRWFVDETYVKVNGRWTYLYRAIDQYGQVIDVWLSARRDLTAARTFFTRALALGAVPVEVTTDRAPAYPRVLDELVLIARHDTERYANNRVEADHGRLKARLRPMRGVKTFRSARILAIGHAFIQNLRRGHYDIATDAPVHHRLPAAFAELALAI